MTLKVYEYSGCSTCKKALKYLDAKGVTYKKIPIRENPPSEGEIKKMIRFMNGEIKKLFNTSGMDYRAMNLKDKISTMNEKQAIALLIKNGNLVKRPFAIDSSWGRTGFKEADWDLNFK